MQVRPFFIFSQFFADRLQLLAEDLVALQLADGALHLVLDLRFELEDLDLLAEEEGEQP